MTSTPTPATPEAIEGQSELRNSIYIASKTKHADRWRQIASVYPVSSTWIYEAGEGETSDHNDLWQRCLAEAAGSKALVLYREADEVLKGGWIELGAALAHGVPVHAVGIEEFTVSKHAGITHHATMKQAVTAALAEPARAQSHADIEVGDAGERWLLCRYVGPAWQEGGSVYWAETDPAEPRRPDYEYRWLEAEAPTGEHARIGDYLRGCASHYPQSSDGRNTFIMAAEWVEARAGNSLAHPSPPIEGLVGTLEMQLRSHECGCGGACGQRTPAYIAKAADALSRLDGLVERLEKRAKAEARLAASDAAVGAMRADFAHISEGLRIEAAQHVLGRQEMLHRFANRISAALGEEWAINSLAESELDLPSRAAISQAQPTAPGANSTLRGLLMEARNGMDEHFSSTDEGVDLNCRIDAAISNTGGSDAGK